MARSRVVGMVSLVLQTRVSYEDGGMVKWGEEEKGEKR